MKIKHYLRYRTKFFKPPPFWTFPLILLLGLVSCDLNDTSLESLPTSLNNEIENIQVIDGELYFTTHGAYEENLKKNLIYG